MLQTALLALTALASVLVASGCGGSSTTGASAGKSVAAAPTAKAATPTAPPTAAETATVPAVAVKMASGTPLSRARWIATGDAACARYNTELSRLVVKSEKEIPRVLPQLVAYQRLEVAALAKLVPPTARAADWQQLLSALLASAEDTGKFSESADLLRTLNSSPLVLASTELRKQAAKLAKRDGFKVCSHA
jgi:hypothetical protein